MSHDDLLKSVAPSRRALLVRMAAAAFATPVLMSYSMDSLAQDTKGGTSTSSTPQPATSSNTTTSTSPAPAPAAPAPATSGNTTTSTTSPPPSGSTTETKK
jgi:hypothetical protein